MLYEQLVLLDFYSDEDDTLSSDSIQRLMHDDGECQPSSSGGDKDGGVGSKDVGCWQDVLGDVSLSGFSDIVTGSSFNINDVMDFVQKQASGSSCLSPAHEETNTNKCFQFILMAPTSAAVPLDLEPLTYLNSQQRYEIKCKRLGNLDRAPKHYRSRLRFSFHNREHQYNEEELLNKWKGEHENKRIIDIDVPNCIATHNMRVNEKMNMIEFLWDPRVVNTSLYIKINIISTEFTKCKHGGEKGIPFRLSMQTFNDQEHEKEMHLCYAQIRVFKTKGADRKNMADRDRAKRYNTKPYQPAWDYTIFTETYTLDSAPCLPIPEAEKALIPAAQAQSTVADDEKFEVAETDDKTLTDECSVFETNEWLSRNRFDNVLEVFKNYSGADLYKLSKDDIISLCPSLPDAIRLYNALNDSNYAPKCTIYVKILERNEAFRAMFLYELSANELRKKLSRVIESEYGTSFDLSNTQLLWLGPDQIKVIVSDEIVQFCISKHSKYNLEIGFNGSQTLSTIVFVQCFYGRTVLI